MQTRWIVFIVWILFFMGGMRLLVYLNDDKNALGGFAKALENTLMFFMGVAITITFLICNLLL